MVKLYCISGLGADFRVFEKLDIEAELIPIVYKPVKRDTSIADYASLLLQQLPKGEPLNILGISFGGVLLQEISKQVEIERAFLISTFSYPNELRKSYRLLAKLKVLTILPKSVFKIYTKAIPFLFGIKKVSNKETLRKIITDTDTDFAKWAVQELLSWKGGHQLKNLVKIHGDNDALIPLKKTDSEIRVIKGAGHLLTLSHPEEASKIINSELKNG